MLSYIAKRLILLIPVLFIVATLVFFLIRLVPGDPVDFILGENALVADRQALIEAQGFDQPLVHQYWHFWKGIVTGELGHSYFTQEEVGQMIKDRYPATLELAFTSILWACVLALPLGILSSLKKGKPFDQGCLVFSLLGISIPTFYLGPLLVLLFSIYLDFFPVGGRDLPGALFLPSLTMGAAMAALLTRMTRSSMLDVLKMDYVQCARAKGLSPVTVVMKHALKSAMVPIVAILGLQFGTLLAGAIITEKIFSWPGLGSLLLEGIQSRDYAVVQGCVLVIAASYVLVNLLTDLVYTKVDPRIEF